MLDARKVNHAQKVIEGLNEPELTAVVIGLVANETFRAAWRRVAATTMPEVGMWPEGSAAAHLDAKTDTPSE